MQLHMRRDGMERLSEMVSRMARDHIESRKTFREWMKQNNDVLSQLFDYDQKPGMPPIHSLVSADFHPELPLVMFNYTPTAHNMLHAHPEGWTNALRMCRGIVFEMGTGKFIAHPFPKFFNLGEHPESNVDRLVEKRKSSHDDRFVDWYATRKMDGHLGIIFEYQGKLYFTTRGTFQSPSAQLGQKMLNRFAREHGWKKTFDPNVTVLVELIDPATKVHVNYGSQSEFVLLGAFNCSTLVDATYLSSHVSPTFMLPDEQDFDWLPNLSVALHLSLPQTHQGHDLPGLVASMKDRDVTNAEGWVIRFADDTRVKVKYETYIGLMVQKKLSPTYIMNRIMAGNLDRMLSTLDEEVVSAAHEMLGRIMRVQFMRMDRKARYQYLYSIVPPEASTAYYRGVCRKFVDHFVWNWSLATPSVQIERAE